MKKLFLFSILSLLPILLFAQAANLDFENWYKDSTGRLRLDNWEELTANGNYPNNSGSSTWRDSGSQHGTYALTLSRWYDYDDDWVRQMSSVFGRPSALSGYYKYIDNALIAGSAAYDTGLVETFLTKWNILTSKEDTIGTGKTYLTSNTLYTAFNCSISYINSSLPDSVIIHIFPSKELNRSGVCQDPKGSCSYLTIDNLSFATPAAVTPESLQYLQFYPNPVENTLTVKSNGKPSKGLQVMMIDALGRHVLTQFILQSTTFMDLTNIPAGNYFIIFKDSESIVQVGKLTKKG